MANKQKVGTQNSLCDYLDTCRVCMEKEGTMQSLFDSDNKIVDEILYCTGINITKNEMFSSLICHNCLTQLATAYNFKSKCTKTQNILTTLLEDIKIENAESNTKVTVKLEIENLTDDDGDGIDFDVLTDDVNDDKDDYDDDDDVSLEKFKNNIMSVKAKRKERTKARQNKHCSICNIDFGSTMESARHRARLHFHGVCEICGKQFWNYASHYSHIRSHAPPKHACSYCDYRTCYKSDLVKHIYTHTGVKNYHCHFCTDVFTTSSRLHGHISSKHTRERKYVCQKCSKGFFTLAKLKIHGETHSNVKRYECEVCHSRFTRRCQWKSHLLKKHNVVTPPVMRAGRRKTNVLLEETPSIFNK